MGTSGAYGGSPGWKPVRDQTQSGSAPVRPGAAAGAWPAASRDPATPPPDTGGGTPFDPATTLD